MKVKKTYTYVFPLKKSRFRNMQRKYKFMSYIYYVVQVTNFLYK